LDAVLYLVLVNFLDLPERINSFLYKKDVGRLTQADRESAKRWTMRLIRDSHPRWTEAQVEADYEKLLAVRIETVDQWSRRFDFTRQ